MQSENILNNTASQKNIRINNSELHSHCIHCGQFLISTADRNSGFCCNGCKAVYHFINNLGLGNFYCIREGSLDWKTTPVSISESTFKYFDDTNFINEYIENDCETGLSVLKLQLEGLHCSACIWLLEKLKDIIPGLIEFRVNILSSKARIKFDPLLLKASAIANTVKGMGYGLHPISPIGDKRINTALGGDRDLAVKLGIAGFCAMNVMLLFIGRYQGIFSGIESAYSDYFAWASMLISIPAVLFSASPFFKTSLAGLKQKRLHIDLPISLAIVGGFTASCINTFLGRPEIYFDTVTALIFLLLCGRWFQRKALNKASDLSDTLYSFAPLSALVKNNSGNFEEVYTSSIKPGDRILIKNQGIFPCDGTIVKGNSFVNNSLLSGESQLIKVETGATVWAGASNEGSELIIEADNNIRQSRFGKLLSNLKDAPITHSKTARFIDRISKYFVFGVLVFSLLTFCFFIYEGFWIAWDRVIALLVVSCPCALGIATPVTLSLANASAARRGILFRTTQALENLSEIKKVIFDKTGTLTYGKLGLADLLLTDPTSDNTPIWDYLFSLEDGSEHPAGKTLYNTAGNNGGKLVLLNDKKTVSGFGISAVDSEGAILRVGSLNWLKKQNIFIAMQFSEFINKNQKTGHILTGMSKNNTLLAIFSLSDTLRIETSNVINKLMMQNVKCSILSGDNRSVVEEISEKLNIPIEGSAECSPEQKAEVLKHTGDLSAYVGDGANDAIALHNSFVGIAIAGGAEVSLKTADIFLSESNLMLVVEAVTGAKKTLRLIRRHLFISLFYNITAATFAIFGLIGPLAAALVMPASSLTVILSSILNIPFKETK